MLNVQGQIENWQDEQRFRGRSAFNGNPIINTTSPIAAITNLSAATGSSSNGVASSSRNSHTPVAGSAVSTQIQQRRPAPIVASNSNGRSNGHTGRSIDDAIAIDDDDDDNTVSVATPAVPPTPVVTNAVPPTTTTQWAAPPPSPPAPAQSHTVVQGPSCPMCNKHCGLVIKSCAEKRGGRKGLKDRIRRLSVITSPSDSQKEALVALYEVYQVVSPFLPLLGLQSTND
jgi:hypothetical protein